MEEKEFDYINVIPFVDIMLVLLTIVLTTSTFIATGMISVSLPKASSVQGEMIQRQIITIDRNGDIYFHTTKMNPEELKKRLMDIDRNTPLILRADAGIALQIFVDVLDLIQNRGFTQVVIQTERRR